MTPKVKIIELLQNNGEFKMRINQRLPLRTIKQEEWSILFKTNQKFEIAYFVAFDFLLVFDSLLVE